MSRTEGLKSNSIEHLLLEGTSLATEVANKSTAAFLSLGIDTILNAQKLLTKSHTSLW